MTDIVERLREVGALRPGDKFPYGFPAANWAKPLSMLVIEAANEIERLRHDLANAQMRYELIDAIHSNDKAHRRYIEDDY